MLPGDFAEAILGQAATPETVAAFQKEIGLDQPAPVQRYFNWIAGVLQGDFGPSFASRIGYRREVADIIGAARLQHAVPRRHDGAHRGAAVARRWALLAALYRNTWFDRAVNCVSLTTISFPEFFIAYILIVLLASPLVVTWSALPRQCARTTPAWASALPRSLPALTLTLVIVAHMMRMTRAAIINLLASPYIEMARLKGAKPWQIILRHALPNAWAPIVNVIAFNLAYLDRRRGGRGGGVRLSRHRPADGRCGALRATCRWCRPAR